MRRTALCATADAERQPGTVMYEGWRISRWETPVVDVRRLALVSLSDVDRELALLLEDSGAPGRPRWRVQFEQYPAYRNIDEAYHLTLWSWLDRSGQRLGHTFTVEESTPLASWGTVYLHEVLPGIRHYVIATEDDVIEVLSTVEPTWEAAPAAEAGAALPGKAGHLYVGEDDSRIRDLVQDLKARREPGEADPRRAGDDEPRGSIRPGQ